MTKEQAIDIIKCLAWHARPDEEQIEQAIETLNQPTCIGAVRFSKEDLREICNERIEIACEHGTCKDCKWWNSDDDKIIGYCHACKHGYYSGKWDISIYRKSEADFYCADFEKRGNENGSN